MHILMTANSSWNILNFRRPIVTALRDEGYAVTIVAPPDDSVPLLEQLGCKFLPLEMSVKGLNPIEDLRLFRSLKQTFRRERPDGVLSFTIKNNIYGALAAKACDIPFIPNVTGLGTAFLSGSALQFIAEKLYHRAFHSLPLIFFENQDDGKLFVDRKIISAKQVHVLPGCGINLSHFLPATFPRKTDAPKFLMIGRVLRDKGVMEFVEAAQNLKLRFPDAIFQILGAIDAKNRSAIPNAVVEDWQSKGLVEYLGSTTDVRPFIGAAHCVVLPSYREGAPRTLIEAAAMARPLVATDVPGCRAVVDDGVTGFLCEARSSTSLMQAFSRFLDLPYADKVAMGLAGRRKMELDFDERIIKTVYREAVREMTGYAFHHR